MQFERMTYDILNDITLSDLANNPGWVLSIIRKAADELKSPAPEEGASWNAALTAAAKLLRDNAAGCSPGSAAEQQNWPFCLETMARAVEKLKRIQSQGERS